MPFTFKKNNKQTKKPVNRFLQDDVSAGIWSLQTYIEIKLCESPWNGPSSAQNPQIVQTKIAVKWHSPAIKSHHQSTNKNQNVKS